MSQSSSKQQRKGFPRAHCKAGCSHCFKWIFFFIIVVSWMLLRINWLDNTVKTAWSHRGFLGKDQFKADRNTCLLRSSPKLDLWLTSAFSKDDVKQGTKAETDRKWVWLPWAKEFPILWELVSKGLGHNQGKKPSVLINWLWKSNSGENRILFLHFTKRTNCNRGKRLQIMQDYLWQQHFMLTAKYCRKNYWELQIKLSVNKKKE